jgi:Protein of unknown function DUF262/HNH endonuclease
MTELDNSQRAIKVSYSHQALQSLNEIFKYLNLSPAFQRKSVWTITDRMSLINTILEGMPCPTIFLYKRWDKRKKRYIHDVIDGKQRLETIFLFSKRLSSERIQVDTEKKNKIRKWLNNNNYSKLTSEQQKDFWNFQIPIGTIEMKDESDDENQGMSDLIVAFVRINTQGRPLAKQERLNAKYINKPVLKLAKDLSKKINNIYSMSADQKGRMKDVEITLELLISIIDNEILNKKSAIEKALGKEFNKKQLKDSKIKFNKISKVFSNLKLGKNARFTRNTSDFYSLFVAIMELINSGCVFQKYSKAQKELTEFSAWIAKITIAHQNNDHAFLKKIANTQFYKYWLTTQRSTDSKEYRKKRSDILKEILLRAFNKKKDKNRFFSIMQKEQIWQQSKNKKCCFPKCNRLLKWKTATVDHIFPWSLGGLTEVSNGQLMCKQHNSMKKDKDFSMFLLVAK